MKYTTEYSRARSLKHCKNYRESIVRLLDSLKERLSVPDELASTETILEAAVAMLQTASLCSMGCSHDSSENCLLHKLMQER